MRLRDYQVAAVEAVLKAWGLQPGDGAEEPCRSCLVNLATSSGKTIIAGALIKEVSASGRCLYIADTDELCQQPIKKFSALGIKPGLEKASSYASEYFKVVVGSAQTLQNPKRLERFGPDGFDFVFVDEAHRGSDRNRRITDYFARAKVCGMTATPFRARLKDLSDYYDRVAFELGLFDLIEEGYSPPLKVLTLPVEVDVRGTQKNGDYDEHKIEERIEPYYHRIAEMILEHAPNRQIIAFLPLISSSQKFVSICQEHGINARHIDGNSPDRVAIQEAFDRKAFQLLSNSSLLTTGWDCHPVDCLLNLTPTRSAGMYRQKVGRIIRVLPDCVDGIESANERKVAIAASAKPDSLILDLLWQTEKFGLQGPSDLIAENQDERLAIEAACRSAKTAEELASIAAAVQKERENALRKALQRAKTFVGVAIEYVAAALHSKAILDYEPVSHWEELEVTEKQGAFLQKQGIDPKSARGRGHVSKLMALLFSRKSRGLAPWRAVDALERENWSKGEALSMTDQEAYFHLGDKYPFPFGKWNGRPFGEVSRSYWQWLSTQAWVERAWPVVWSHLVTLDLVEGPVAKMRDRKEVTEEITEMFDALD